MKAFLLANEVLLIEVDGWGIIEDPTGGGSIYGAHQGCCVEFNIEVRSRPDKDALVYGVYCWEKEEPAECRRCSKPVPESVQTLIRLHSWKR